MPRVSRKEKIGAGEGYFSISNWIKNPKLRMRTPEKEYVFKLIQELEGFFMIEVLFCSVQKDSYHLICYSPGKAPNLRDTATRYNAFYGDSKPALKAKGDTCRKVAGQMVDVSQFMRVFQQRLSCAINRSNKHKGSVWADRFKSVVLSKTGDSEWSTGNGVGIKLG